MRLRKRPWINEAIKNFSDFVLTKDQNLGEERRGTWRKMFENPNSELHVELGTGKGDFISQLAQRNPDINYLGFELQQDVIYTAAKKIRELKLQNVRLIVFDINLIDKIFAEHEIDRIYLNFCDPWPKKRHAKRRLTHEIFLQKYQQLLKPHGAIFFKTDNRGLFDFSLEEFQKLGMEISEISFDLHAENFPDNIETEYEKKFSERGEKICRCVAVFP